ncbi:MAG: ethanolamine utilization protein EutN [Rhodospirillaceae bacterium]|nr:hypothetical protein [Rhodospirillaceae bacterium]MXW92619.1 ethanolamine utilization protein EutN [Rhodospirillaceae bacterium]MYB13859.1 ethanolamine utilization protein EutN [Rhodospirillaceae bacterium]MYI48690.1 ethanolamine utilization protein EutN [Rhodospirillaceae bacterium]
MKTGTVVGRVWATKRIDRLPAGALLEIELDGRAKERVIAFDPLGSGDGERVLVTFGRAATNWFPEGKAVVDALIVGSLDENGS